MAITKFDQFDFLIDIVPRDELKPNKGRDDASIRTASMNPDQVRDVISMLWASSLKYNTDLNFYIYQVSRNKI
jgi:hypothetical protein